MGKYTYRLDTIKFHSRWKYKSYARPCDWTIVGISVWWCGPENFEYRLSFFGLMVRIMIIKHFK